MEPVERDLGEYRLLARLATGGQSEVFLAARGGPHGFFRPVVIKAIPEHFKGRERLEALFYQEATISSRFSHPHVVTIHDARRVDDEDFMVMDYIPGQTMADLAQRAFSTGSGLSPEESILMIIDACRGLEYVHRFEDVDRELYQVVHCDISPQNLMVTYSGLVRVFDFGISQVLGVDGTLKSELVGGKFAYMSPEQSLGEAVDPRSDVFSLGVILHELVTGRRLFRRGEREEVLRAITSEEIPKPSTLRVGLPSGVDDAVLKALARDKENRFENARHFRKALEAILDQMAMSKEDIRTGLSEKISSLFDEERQQIAKLIKKSRREMKGDTYPLRAISAEAQALESMLTEANVEIDELASRAQRATEVANRLTEEVTRLQKQQRWFVAAICGLSILAVAIALTAYFAGDQVPSLLSEAVAEE